MLSSNLCAVAGVLAVVCATPLEHAHHRHGHGHVAERAVTWITEVQEAVVTVPVTETIYLAPGEAVPTSASMEDSTFPAIAAAVPTTTTLSTIIVPTSTSTHTTPHSSSSTSTTSSSTSTSVYVAPPEPTTTSVYTPPAAQTTPSSSSSAAASSSQQASSSSSSSSSSSGSGNALTGLAAPGTSYTGDLTYYDPTVGLSACGTMSTNSAPIVALSHVIFSTYPRDPATGNPVICGKQITITGVDGSPYTATIVDMCPGCNEGSLDLSQGFFNEVTSNGNGRVSGMHWTFD